jgi:ribonuclease R
MEAILADLLVELGQAYEQSDIRQYCLDKDREWHYSLITTTLKKGGPLILGFNWGASQGEVYKPQATIEEAIFKSGDVGSLSRIFPYCEKYFGSDFLNKTSQSNYCFFRSKNESEITPKDIALCEPIFKRLIEVIEPSSILCFSSKLRDYLFSNGKVQTKESIKISYKRGSVQMTYEPIRATLTFGTKIMFLPHPNYPMKKEARDEAWKFCCNERVL